MPTTSLTSATNNKGSDVGPFDDSGTVTRLFNPRSDVWDEHFRRAGGTISPLTPVGQATARILLLNTTERCAEREASRDEPRPVTADT